MPSRLYTAIFSPSPVAHTHVGLTGNEGYLRKWNECYGVKCLQLQGVDIWKIVKM